MFNYSYTIQTNLTTNYLEGNPNNPQYFIRIKCKITDPFLSPKVFWRLINGTKMKVQEILEGPFYNITSVLKTIERCKLEAKNSILKQHLKMYNKLVINLF